ncbi:MAG: ABC transporter ATP-binding protein, partial [Ignavibacteriales bacterium]|nr:ABC transporter ATP-binding protein [Ignavibacteriales bacterium]
RALQDFNLSVNKGDVLGIIGFNGSGKSTLLKVISRITPPSTGEIHIRGSVSSLLDIGLGFHPDLTGRENIYLNGAILGMKRNEITTKFADIVAFSGIDEKFLDTPVKRYSSGMFVRLAFSIAAHLDSDILLIDEVLAVGDYEFQKKCLDKINSITQSRRTVLFVSHNLLFIERLCNRTILINKGIKLFDGNTSNAILKYYSLQKNQVTSRNLLSEKISRSGKGDIRFKEVQILDKNNKPVEKIYPADSLIIKMNFNVMKPVHHPRIALTFKTALGQTLFQLYSKESGQNISELAENSFVLCHLHNIPLLPGTYYLNLWIADQFNVQDYIEHGYSINIQSNKSTDTNAQKHQFSRNIFVKHTWNIQKI